MSLVKYFLTLIPLPFASSEWYLSVMLRLLLGIYYTNRSTLTHTHTKKKKETITDRSLN